MIVLSVGMQAGGMLISQLPTVLWISAIWDDVAEQLQEVSCNPVEQ